MLSEPIDVCEISTVLVFVEHVVKVLKEPIVDCEISKVLEEPVVELLILLKCLYNLLINCL